MKPVLIALDDHTYGDTWNAPGADDPGGMDIGPVLFDGLAPPESLISCRLYFRKEIGGSLGYGFTSETLPGFGQITIVNAATWSVRIEPQPLPLALGDWLWDFETTDAAGVIRTLYKGELSVVRDQSHDDD